MKKFLQKLGFFKNDSSKKVKTENIKKGKEFYESLFNQELERVSKSKKANKSNEAPNTKKTMSLSNDEYLSMLNKDLAKQAKNKVGFFEKCDEIEKLKTQNDERSIRKLIEFQNDNYIPVVLSSTEALIELKKDNLDEYILRGLDKVESHIKELKEKAKFYSPFDEETAELFEMEWVEYDEQLEGLKNGFGKEKKLNNTGLSSMNDEWVVYFKPRFRIKYFCFERHYLLFNPKDVKVLKKDKAMEVVKKMNTQNMDASAIPLIKAIEQYKESAKGPHEPLLESLISKDDKVFVEGLTAACEVADQGAYLGADTIREALRIRSGKDDVNFYKPKITVSNSLFDNNAMEAKEKIVGLAKRKALLDNVEYSGDLITKFSINHSHNELVELLHKVYEVGGDSQGQAFQLMKNEIKFSTIFNL